VELSSQSKDTGITTFCQSTQNEISTTQRFQETLKREGEHMSRGGAMSGQRTARRSNNAADLYLPAAVTLGVDRERESGGGAGEGRREALNNWGVTPCADGSRHSSLAIPQQ